MKIALGGQWIKEIVSTWPPFYRYVGTLICLAACCWLWWSLGFRPLLKSLSSAQREIELGSIYQKELDALLDKLSKIHEPGQNEVIIQSTADNCAFLTQVLLRLGLAFEQSNNGSQDDIISFHVTGTFKQYISFFNELAKTHFNLGLSECQLTRRDDLLIDGVITCNSVFNGNQEKKYGTELES